MCQCVQGTRIDKPLEAGINMFLAGYGDAIKSLVSHDGVTCCLDKLHLNSWCFSVLAAGDL